MPPCIHRWTARLETNPDEITNTCRLCGMTQILSYAPDGVTMVELQRFDVTGVMVGRWLYERGRPIVAPTFVIGEP